MNKHLDVLMHKEMTRKEFIGSLGFGLAALCGMSTVIRLVTGKTQHGFLSGYGAGYSGGTYGGGKQE